MRTAIDTNVPSALLSKESHTIDAMDALAGCRRQGQLLLSPIVFSELHAYPGMTENYLAQFLSDTAIQVDFMVSEGIWKEAGRRYARYASRRRKGHVDAPRRLIADFIIGSHALLTCDRLLTFDPKFFVRNFPELPLYQP